MTVQAVATLDPELKLSRLIYGTWRLLDRSVSSSDLEKLVELCLEVGVNTFDLADIYGDYLIEDYFGGALPAHLRTRIQVITKCGICLRSNQRPLHRHKFYQVNGQHIRQSVEQSLRHLRREWIDVLLIHRPDPLTNFQDVAEEFRALKDEGKVKAFGVSNFSPIQLQSLQSQLDLPLIANQIELNPLQASALWDGTLDHAQAHAYLPMVWSPLAGGRIFTHPEYAGLRQQLATIAQRYACDMDQLLIAWLLLLPSRALPVIGTADPQRLLRQLQATEINLDRQDWFAILEAAQGKEVP
ncbi:MAG: aldo/keto reductase [Oligoflexus sp.]